MPTLPSGTRLGPFSFPGAELRVPPASDRTDKHEISSECTYNNTLGAVEHIHTVKQINNHYAIQTSEIISCVPLRENNHMIEVNLLSSNELVLINKPSK